jgi:hypothetical protein
LFQEFVACIIIHKCGFSHFKIQRNNTFNQYQSKKKLKRSKKNYKNKNEKNGSTDWLKELKVV